MIGNNYKEVLQYLCMINVGHDDMAAHGWAPIQAQVSIPEKLPTEKGKLV